MLVCGQNFDLAPANYPLASCSVAKEQRTWLSACARQFPRAGREAEAIAQKN
jgi:hypothetical protein